MAWTPQPHVAFAQPGSLQQETDRWLCQPDLHTHGPQSELLHDNPIPPQRGHWRQGEEGPQMPALLVCLKLAVLHGWGYGATSLCKSVCICRNTFTHICAYIYGFMGSVYIQMHMKGNGCICMCLHVCAHVGTGVHSRPA